MHRRLFVGRHRPSVSTIPSFSPCSFAQSFLVLRLRSPKEAWVQLNCKWVYGTLQCKQPLEEHVDSAEQLEVKADEAMSRLHFIPGIVVHGHSWALIFSTREGAQTILWKDQEFGSTRTILETYQIVAGVRTITDWAVNIYMPWFHKHILGGFKHSKDKANDT